MEHEVELLTDWVDSFFEFFEWLYELELKDGARARVELELKRGWSNPDDSEVVFFTRVLRAHDQVKAAAAKDVLTMRAKARENLKAELADTALTDKSRVLATLHAALESARPGSTGVAAVTRLRRPDPLRPVARTEPRPSRAVEPDGDRRPPAEVEAGARHTGRVPLPPTPSLSGLDPSRIAQALAEYWERVQRVHTMNGDTFEAQRAMQNHQNYMNMMISFNRTSDEIIKNIWR